MQQLVRLLVSLVGGPPICSQEAPTPAATRLGVGAAVDPSADVRARASAEDGVEPGRSDDPQLSTSAWLFVSLEGSMVLSLLTAEKPCRHSDSSLGEVWSSTLTTHWPTSRCSDRLDCSGVSSSYPAASLALRPLRNLPAPGNSGDICTLTMSAPELRLMSGLEREAAAALRLGAILMTDQAKMPMSCSTNPTTCVLLSNSPRRADATHTITTSFMSTPVRMKVIAELLLMKSAWTTFIAKARQPLARRSQRYSTKRSHGGNESASGTEAIGMQCRKTRTTPSTKSTMGATTMTYVRGSSRRPELESE
mmetsp:Transcript_8864/g.23759  ORF Transcript_8864/g.23759 Transcript_8864/m.23759 type:complete len:308 (-) Transcript_8864:780-1703(-)